MFDVSLTFVLFFVCLLFLARTARAVNTTLRGADALHLQIVQRTEDIFKYLLKKVGFTRSTT